ncbi:MAG: membrane protein insertion efficiency factor YidD [Melioribacteraceae bacterium]|nr:membrane protein insertion efficiency factor YidD [Melioribacteraceae bacterium]MCF8414159.1 membrane protein insertion efficiency factor YidD [Melioribacteraceae bacterium]
MKIILILLVLTGNLCFAQTDWVKWDAEEISYTIKSDVHQKRIFDDKTISSTILSAFKFSYGYLFSDLDGDNCPFHPTCSEFFIQSAKENGLHLGLMMFTDRFARDTNLFKNYSYYPIHKSGRFYDPSKWYGLSGDQIFEDEKKNVLNFQN